ncbi:MAG TPA: hypothetical protein VLB27_03230, partial [candidate division Zixibacteria bacterium]|nr:hypothetical protein [candidate division Zixibacteria bacterium]
MNKPGQWFAVALIVCALPAVAVAQQPLHDFLAPDGTVDITHLQESGYEGALDISGWNIEFHGSTGAPVFSLSGSVPTVDDCWSDEFPRPGASSTILASTLHNGKLIVGGAFSEIGGVQAQGVAAWNGTHWEAFGSGLGGVVWALGVFNGELHAGGDMNISGLTARIARWDGSSWQMLGTGVNNSVRALTTYGGELIAGGNFSTAGGSPANGVARWDGTNWNPLGAGVNSRVNALIEYAGRLYAGGTFSLAGGSPAAFIASWDGANWAPLGSGTNGEVRDLTIDHLGFLGVGGAFSVAGGLGASHVAGWNGGAWFTYGGGLIPGTGANAIAVSGGTLYAATNLQVYEFVGGAW